MILLTGHAPSGRGEGIRHRLGWKPGIANGHGDEPGNMLWRTYWRLLARHDAAANEALAGSAAQVRRMMR